LLHVRFTSLSLDATVFIDRLANSTIHGTDTQLTSHSPRLFDNKKALVAEYTCQLNSKKQSVAAIVNTVLFSKQVGIRPAKWPL